MKRENKSCVRKTVDEDKRRIVELEERLAKAEKEKPNMDKWFEENIETITKKFNDYGVDMKIRNDSKKTQ